MSALVKPGTELSLPELYTATQQTKYFALAVCVFLASEIVATIPDEVKYIWHSRWSFGRIMFHANRLWGATMLAIYVPSLFVYHMSEEACLAFWLFYIYGSIIVQAIVASILSARVWAIYETKTSALLILCIGWAALSVPSILFLQMQANQSNLLKNPAPSVISGCPTALNPLAFVPYIPPFLAETVLFIMTVYKPWKLNQQISTSLRTRLIRSGTQYYVAICAALVVIVVGSLFQSTNHAVNGAGLMTAVWSSMCTRIILSGRAWYDKSESRSRPAHLEMDIIPGMGWCDDESTGQESPSTPTGA